VEEDFATLLFACKFVIIVYLMLFYCKQVWSLYLKGLEIQGFKSFPDKTTLSFAEDFTAIVGPNGSGKSNISDAIRWVMGEQSTRALRGGKMEDVIFGGTEKRAQVGFAEVSLILDNTGHFFDREETEVVVTRRYYRSGDSEYFINRHAVRLRDVNELFMDTGLGREGYSIIGQGKIDEILSAKSGDRRNVFEEAAGISRFRHRKEESERKLGHTSDNLVRINDKIEELELQVVPLQKQAETAKQFLVFRDELRGLEISLWLQQLEKLRTDSIKLNTDYDLALRQKDAVAARVEELYDLMERLFEQIRNCDLEMDSIRQNVSGEEASANERESRIMVLKNDMKNNEENRQRLEQELAQAEGRAGSLSQQIEDKRSRLEEIATAELALMKALSQKQSESEEAGKSAGVLAAELEALRSQASMEQASAAETRALLSALSAAEQELLDRDSAIRRDLEAQKLRSGELQSEFDAAQGELTQAQEERTSLLNIIGGYQLRFSKREERKKSAEEIHMKLRMDENALAQRMRLLQDLEKHYEGFSKAVKLIMGEAERGNLKGIHGPVAGLIQTPDAYTVAIETALGGNIGNIVVEDEEDGKAAINYLKRRGEGRATFLPLSAIQPNELREQGLEKQAGFVGIAAKLISFNKRFEKAIYNLLGRVVIAENMDAAIAIARNYRHKFRIVTLDGQVLNAGGSMTGGAVSRSAGVLTRSNELERLQSQQEDLKGQVAAAGEALETAVRELTAASYEMETAAAQQRSLEDTILTMEERVSRLDGALADLRRSEANLQEELEELQQRTQKAEVDRAAAKSRIAQLEGAAEALQAESESKAAGQGDVKNRAELIQGEIARLHAEQSGLEAERSATATSLSELEGLKADISGDRHAQSSLISHYEETNVALAAEILEQEQLLQTIRADLNSTQEAIAKKNEERLALEAQRNSSEREARSKNEELRTTERNVAFLEQKKQASDMQQEQLINKLWENYELSHEAALRQRIELESLPKAQRRIGELKRGISALGHINIGAIEEYDRVNTRYTYLAEQRDDVESAKKELEAIIANITAEMERIFSAQFTIIRQEFEKTFIDLFGGGRATLELEDEEDILSCGIEIKVQPPGKALKVLSLLSGGEKAFVAIALYCAILKVRPTPFVVMDEIEAALDESNVVRFARYLRNISDRTQFIVITHRRGTMEEADVLYGVTMQTPGISRILTINLNDVEAELSIK